MPERKDLEKLFDLIKIWAKEDEWFKSQLSKEFGTNFHSVNGDIQKIKEFLEINCNQSVNYDFIKNKFLRTQLEIDNLRMENCCLDLKEKDELERFYNFCVNAFYQVENLINFHYYTRFPVLQDLLSHISQVPNIRFDRSNHTSVATIHVSTKIFAYRNSFLNKKSYSTGASIDNLRKIRNSGLHRCSVIKANKSEDPTLFDFFKTNTFTTVRNTLQGFVTSIKENT
jgi:hypothetical protein